jgi:hypothetical protein
MTKYSIPSSNDSCKTVNVEAEATLTAMAHIGPTMQEGHIDRYPDLRRIQ